MLMDRTCLAGALGSTLSRKHAYWTMDPPGVEPAGGGGGYEGKTRTIRRWHFPWYNFKVLHKTNIYTFILILNYF